MSTQLAEAGDNSLNSIKDPADRSILIGVGATVLFHLLLLLLSPQFSMDKFSGVHTGISVNHANQGKTFDFELAPPDPVEQKKPLNFVDTNPEAPENQPDKTNNFSNRDQQAAQPDKVKELDPEHRSAIKNAQDKIKNDNSVVSGDLSKPQLGAAAMPESAKNDQSEQKEQKVRMAQTPTSGFDKIEGKSEDGIASNISQAQAPSTHADQTVDGARDARDPDGGLLAITDAHKAQPKARPKLTQARTTILTNRAAGVSQIGVGASDAFKSEYGEYLNELMEIVQIQWYSIIEESRVSPPHGTHVAITFKLNSKGETDIVKVEDFDAGKQGIFSCQTAIQKRQPYRKWTEQMISLLGDEQTLTFDFYYM
ncbi:MAG: hypothetical protein WDM96_06045 [Lacunisphaera sp.]